MALAGRTVQVRVEVVHTVQVLAMEEESLELAWAEVLLETLKKELCPGLETSLINDDETSFLCLTHCNEKFNSCPWCIYFVFVRDLLGLCV